MDESRRSYLIDLIRSQSSPFFPSPPPDLPPSLAERLYPRSDFRGDLRSDPGDLPGEVYGGWPFPAAPLKAVFFDIYGTLFLSSAGDIQNGQGGGGNTEQTGDLDGLARKYTGKPRGRDLMDYFRSSVLGIHRERASQTPFPEVRVEEIWADFLRSRTSLGADTAALPGKTALAGQATLLEQAALLERQESLDDQAEELALRFELTVNPVYPMPGVGETLGGLKRAGYILGLISNAQFFTPLLFDALLGASPEALGFDPSLLIYSYEIGEAKPATRLFSLALDRLAPRKIGAENCLYVGNDMRNDIYGAASAGYQTALFAGDSRSLRLREAGQDPPGTILPSVVIRHLTDLLSLPAAGTVVRRDGI